MKAKQTSVEKTQSLKMIPLAHLAADPRNANVCSPETMAKLSSNIQSSGFCPPLIVRPHPDKANRFIIIDGHHRHQVLSQLNWSKAPAVVLQTSEKDTLLLLATLNRLRGEDQPRKRAELLESLLDQFNSDDLAKLIPESEKEIEDLLSLLRLDEAAMEEQLKAAIEKETQELPVLLHFLAQPKDAEVIQRAIAQYQPTGTSDHTCGLVEACSAALSQMKDMEDGPNS